MTAANQPGIEEPGQAGTVRLLVDGKEVGMTELKRTLPAAFTATETFHVGIGLGATVELNDVDRRPFAFTRKIDQLTVELVKYQCPSWLTAVKCESEINDPKLNSLYWTKVQ